MAANLIAFGVGAVAGAAIADNWSIAWTIASSLGLSFFMTLTTRVQVAASQSCLWSADPGCEAQFTSAASWLFGGVAIGAFGYFVLTEITDTSSGEEG